MAVTMDSFHLPQGHSPTDCRPRPSRPPPWKATVEVDEDRQRRRFGAVRDLLPVRRIHQALLMVGLALPELQLPG